MHNTDAICCSRQSIYFHWCFVLLQSPKRTKRLVQNKVTDRFDYCRKRMTQSHSLGKELRATVRSMQKFELTMLQLAFFLLQLQTLFIELALFHFIKESPKYWLGKYSPRAVFRTFFLNHNIQPQINHIYLFCEDFKNQLLDILHYKRN